MTKSSPQAPRSELSAPVDAILILSFGGPEGPADLMPFLRNVTQGRDVPDERLAQVARQYDIFGGRSPINDQCRALAAALEQRLEETGQVLPVYFGARNWHPFVTDIVQMMAEDGIQRAVVFVTSAFGTYSGCRQYQEDIAAATAAVDQKAAAGAPSAPQLHKLRLFYNHPGFIEPMADAVTEGIKEISPGTQGRVLFSAHSIPESMAVGCDYQNQLTEAASLIMEQVAKQSDVKQDLPDFDIVFQSRSGPPQIPWLQPDINDHITALSEQGSDAVVVVPLGFTSDHMEVMFDLDTQAAATAASLGLRMIRVPTVGTDRRYVDMIIELIGEVANGNTPVALGSKGPWPSHCPEGHCPPPARRPG